jgi:hypothetical protein
LRGIFCADFSELCVFCFPELSSERFFKTGEKKITPVSGKEKWNKNYLWA